MPAQATRKKPRVKAGTSRAEALMRKRLFALAMLQNNGNQTHAAISAGFAPGSATQTGSKLVRDPYVIEFMNVNRDRFAVIAGLDADRTLKEVARLAYFDPASTQDAAGNAIPIHIMSPDARAAIKKEKALQTDTGAVVVEREFYDKRGALDMAMKFHGHYEKDNNQRKGECLALKVVLV